MITASREDLGAAVTAGRFRAELFYRLNVIHLAVPATWGIAEGGPLQSLLAGCGRSDTGASLREAHRVVPWSRHGDG